MALLLYAVGYAVVIAGLAWAAALLGAPGRWILAGVVLLAALALLSLLGGRNRGTRPPPAPGG